MGKSRTYPPGAKPLTFAEFKAIYSKVPRLCVDLVITSPEGVLLTLRDIDPWRNQWHLPGGTVLLGETMEDAIKRVGLEELGLEVEKDKVLGVVEFFNSEIGHNHSVSVTYLVKILNGELQINNEALAAKYFKELPENTIIEHKKFLEGIKF